MEGWPSKRVPHGGLFAPRINKYSPETHKLLKVLMEEQKLSMLQRKQVDRCLRDGSSLPEKRTGGEARKESSEFVAMTTRMRQTRLRTQSAIRKSGAYDPPRMPFHPTVDREKAKQHLQNIMTGYDQGSYANYLRGSKGPRKDLLRKEKPEPPSRLQELMDEVKERIHWLNEMTALGQDKLHRDPIKQQIAEKMRQIKALKAAAHNLTDGKSDDLNK